MSRPASIPVRGRVIRSEEFAALKKAYAIEEGLQTDLDAAIEAARDHADSLVAQAKVEAREIVEEAVAKAREAADHERLHRLMAMVEGNARRLVALEAELATVALEAVKAYLDQVPDTDLIRSLIRRQLEGVIGQERLTVRVHPDDKHAAQEAIRALEAQWPYLSLSVDAALAPGDVILECAAGLIEGSLSGYLGALENALR